MVESGIYRPVNTFITLSFVPIRHVANKHFTVSNFNEPSEATGFPSFHLAFVELLNAKPLLVEYPSYNTVLILCDFVFITEGNSAGFQRTVVSFGIWNYGYFIPFAIIWRIIWAIHSNFK